MKTNRWQSMSINWSIGIDNRWKLIIDEIDNHKKLGHRLFIDYRYQSINWHRLSSTDRLIFRSSVSSIVHVLINYHWSFARNNCHASFPCVMWDSSFVHVMFLFMVSLNLNFCSPWFLFSLFSSEYSTTLGNLSKIYYVWIQDGGICCETSWGVDEKWATKGKFVAQSRPALSFSQQLSSTCNKLLITQSEKMQNINPKLATKHCCVTSWGFLYLVFRHPCVHSVDMEIWCLHVSTRDFLIAKFGFFFGTVVNSHKLIIFLRVSTLLCQSGIQLVMSRWAQLLQGALRSLSIPGVYNSVRTCHTFSLFR